MMSLPQKTAVVFGGTGFIGRYVVQRLARAGYTVKVATRVPARAYFLRPYGTVGQIVPLACNLNNPADVAAAVAGCDVTVNTVGILYERRKGQFTRVHADAARAIAQACAAAGVKRFVHLSALGIDRAGSRYAASKRAGEDAVRQEFPAVTILRPSVVFGPEDRFFNLFAELSRYLPVLPLIGGGHTRFQPVYVADVADAVMAALAQPETAGKIYELGGSEIVTFREVYERLAVLTRRKRILMTLPWGMAKIQASFMQLLPAPLLTRDQVESLKTDSVVTPGAAGLHDLGLHPTPMGEILPSYMEHYRPGGRFADKVRA